MGIKQFSSSLADFNQGQLDSIQTSSNTIKTSTDTIKTTVDSIKNTDLSNVSNSMREKKTSKFTRSGTAFFSAQYNVYGTVLNLTGNGFIDHALFEAFDNSNNLCVRITIDGAVVVNSQGKMYAGLISDKSGAIEGSYWGTWDFQTNTFVPINTTTTPTLYGNSAGGAVVSGVVLVPDGLKFNTSCLIEVMQIYNATAQNVAYSLKYAM